MSLFMPFPVEEWASLRERLGRGDPIYTTRISVERNRYQEGQQVQSPFGTLHVERVQQYACLEEHPFLTELTPTQARMIRMAGGFTVIKLTKA